MEQFGSTPATYVDNESGILLRVGPGCLSARQRAGPITVIRNKKFIVEVGGSHFLVSAVVDCQPSGAVFREPLWLEFLVGEADEDLPKTGPGNEGRQEYLTSLATTYKVMCSWWDIRKVVQVVLPYCLVRFAVLGVQRKSHTELLNASFAR